MTFEQWIATQTNSPTTTSQNAANEQKQKEKKEKAIASCEAFIARLRQKRRQVKK